MLWHLRKTFDRIVYIIIRFEKSFAEISTRLVSRRHDKFSSTIAIKESNFEVIKTSTSATQAEFTMLIIQSSVDSDLEIDIDYDFRDWNHAKTDIALFETTTFKKSCLDTDARLTLVDRQFLKSQASNVHLRIMITSLIIRDLSTRQHKIDEYVMIFIFMIEINVVDENVRATFRREIHVVDDLKTNILIDNDIMSSKDISIDSDKYTAHIESCKITILVEIKNSRTTVSKLVHSRKTTIISSRTKLSIEIHHLVVFDKEYLFELEDISYLTTYAQLVNVFTKVVVLRNESNKSIQVSRNHRLSRLNEFDYFNAYHFDIIDDAKSLVAKCFEIIHKQN